ncbi:glycoside hydrolase family 172 protein [Flavitalea sp.]|nr:glycoside hydrolase family 172 protein [Flavitalea sp.]
MKKIVLPAMKLIISVFALLMLIIPLNAQVGENDMIELAKIKKGIRSKRVSSYDTTGGNGDYLAKIKSGEKKSLFDVKGAGIINHIWITIAPGPETILRDDIILRMYWDGNSFPSVEAPLGSFFGQGWNEAYPYYTQPLNVTPGNSKALVSYFAMPFAKGARIEIENQNEKTIDNFYYYVDYQELDQLPADLGRFHAWFNNQVTETDPVERENEWSVLKQQVPNKTPERNYLIADIKGKGQFVGVNYYVNSPSPIWYGEGDDMFFIDGSTRPALHGTGTEDYFNTSWCPKEIFMTPYFGYPKIHLAENSDKRFDIGFSGRTHVYRYHIMDPVYFDKSLKFSIEHGHNNVLVLELRSVAYWYQSEAAQVPSIKSKTERKPMPIINPVDVHRWRDVWRKSKGDSLKLWGN